MEGWQPFQCISLFVFHTPPNLHQSYQRVRIRDLEATVDRNERQEIVRGGKSCAKEAAEGEKASIKAYRR
jgi:hypothetical protein